MWLTVARGRPTLALGMALLVKAALVAVAAVLAPVSPIRPRHPMEPGARLPLATRLDLGALATVLAVTGLPTVLTPPAKPICWQSDEEECVHEWGPRLGSWRHSTAERSSARSDDFARETWLLTAPRLIPRAEAIWDSGRSA
jgi:hypothetical protein